METVQNHSDFEQIEGQIDCWDNPNLRCVDEIPPPFRQIFSKYPTFNVLQSQVFDEVFYSDNPLVISAPTGSGKTVIFELAIARLLINMKYNNVHPSFKAVYVAPMKALCEERMLDWHGRFNEFGINCISVTGDSDIVDCQSLMSHNLIITTPEKWDAITRKWKDNRNLVEAVILFMIDEVHLLNEDTRGPTLEAVVSRMKIVQSYVGTVHKIRFIALSATIPNAKDITEWLDQCSVNPAKCFKFADDIRPVKLTRVVLGYPFNPLHSTPFKFDIMLNYKLHPIMLKYAQGKPVLIFCSTRKSVEMTAKHLMLNITVDLTPDQKRVLEEAASNVTDNNVRSLLVHGIASHHAGMLPENRKAVENLFRQGHLPILVATSTLAMGVNLPAHLVIVKTTKHYQNGEYKNYSESAILQMIGRAGRPGFDTAAFAVIMTTADDKGKYENMISGSQCVESNFHLHLTEHLNSEVVLGTISDLSVAMEWLTSTFLYVRAKKHPKHYGLPVGLTSDQLDKRLLEMCQIEINKLAKAGMLIIDENTSITPMLLGYLMAKYYLAFHTMKLFTELNGTEILPQMLNIISNCQEFSDLYLRVNDKKALNLLNKCKNKETIRFPLNGRIKTLSMKINCLIQAVFGSLEVLEHSLQNDAQKIMRSGEKISKCLLEYLESPDFIQVHPKAYSALLSANILAKCFHTRLWENSKHVARQLPGIGITSSAQLVMAKKTSFDAILEANPRDLERILGKKPPQGNNIQDLVGHLPKYLLQVSHEEKENGVEIRFTITLTNAEDIEEKCTVDKNCYMVLLVGDSFNNIYFYEKYSHDYMLQNGEIQKTFKSCSSEKHEVGIHFISQTWVGIDCLEKLIVNTKQSKNKNISKLIKNKNSNTKKKSPDENKEIKKPTITVQQFLDVYMKKTKSISKRVSPEKQSNPPTVPVMENGLAEPETEISSQSVDSLDEILESATDLQKQNSTTEQLNKNYDTEEAQLTKTNDDKDTQSSKNYDNKDKAPILDFTEKEEANDEIEREEEDEDKIVFDIMDEQYEMEPLPEKEKLPVSVPLYQTRRTNSPQEKLTNNEKGGNDATKYLFELIFKDDDKTSTLYNKNQNAQSQPDSTSYTNDEIDRKLENLGEYEQKSTENKKICENNQKSITWRSPLIISPTINCFETETESIKNFEHTSGKKTQSPDFSIKLLDTAYCAPLTKKSNAQAPMRKGSCKFQLADKEYNTNIQPSVYEKLNEYSTQNEFKCKPLQPNQEYDYHSIKVIDTKRTRNTTQLSPASDISTINSSTSSTLIRNEMINNDSFQKPNEPDVKEYRLKHFLSQFKRDEKAKLGARENRSQPSTSKWNKFLEENHEPPKWKPYQFEHNNTFTLKRKAPEEFYDYNFISKSKENIPPKKVNCNFAELESNQSPSVYSMYPRNVSKIDAEHQHSAYSRRYMNPSKTRNFTMTPQRYFTQEHPFVEFPNSTSCFQPYQSNFTHHEEIPFNQYTRMPQGNYQHQQYFSQPVMHHFPATTYVAPGKCRHCSCCQATSYNAPHVINQSRMPFLHYESEEEQCEGNF